MCPIIFNRSRARYVLNGGRVRPYIVLVSECSKTKKEIRRIEIIPQPICGMLLCGFLALSMAFKDMCQFEWTPSISSSGRPRKGDSPDTKEYGRAIWTVNAVNHGGVTFRRFGRPNFGCSTRECCSAARSYSKRRWLKSEISVAIKIDHLMRDLAWASQHKTAAVKYIRGSGQNSNIIVRHRETFGGRGYDLSRSLSPQG
jgi:hypothetical protein